MQGIDLTLLILLFGQIYILLIKLSGMITFNHLILRVNVIDYGTQGTGISSSNLFRKAGSPASKTTYFPDNPLS